MNIFGVVGSYEGYTPFTEENVVINVNNPSFNSYTAIYNIDNGQGQPVYTSTRLTKTTQTIILPIYSVLCIFLTSPGNNEYIQFNSSVNMTQFSFGNNVNYVDIRYYSLACRITQAGIGGGILNLG